LRLDRHSLPAEKGVICVLDAIKEAPMKRSTDRLLTTHAGSLPRQADLFEMMLATKQLWGRN
jgi:hypothetical protein